jgi:hypothetical protein
MEQEITVSGKENSLKEIQSPEEEFQPTLTETWE